MQKNIKKNKMNNKKHGRPLLIEMINSEYIFLLFKDLIIEHFKNLADEIGDTLIMFEICCNINNTKEGYQPDENIQKVRNKVDNLGIGFDEILNKSKLNIITEIEYILN